jgi:hypothetical protein
MCVVIYLEEMSHGLIWGEVSDIAIGVCGEENDKEEDDEDASGAINLKFFGDCEEAIKI